mmetsp:Transcript_30980/g.70904  ORF Transcript_30980/g.70904 Transcript_30980/m.70904 type:complete len:186 (+) Transcript_30980:24-581(+)
MAGTEELQDDGENLFYASQKVLTLLKIKLAKGESIDKDLLISLSIPGDFPDDEMLLPIDLRCLDKDFPGEDLINEFLHLDVEKMVEKLGTEGAAKIFLQAQQLYLDNKDKLPEDERLEPMTAAKWREDFGGDGMLGEEGGEEELLVEDEEEDEQQEQPVEPNAKRKRVIAREEGEEEEAKKAKTK